MSIAALRPAGAVYREDQHFAWWIYALLAVMAVLGGAAPALRQAAAPAAGVGHGWGLEVPIGLAIGLALPAILIVGVLHMTTEVAAGQARVWFGLLPTFRHAVALDAVERLEVVRFRPIADYGFWGVRWGRDGERALIARGDRGVRLHFADGTRLLIGSQNPEALASALTQAMNRGA